MKNNIKINSVIIALAVCMLATGCANNTEISDASSSESTQAVTIESKISDTSSSDDSSDNETTTTTTTTSTTAKTSKTDDSGSSENDSSDSEADAAATTTGKSDSSVTVKSKDSTSESKTSSGSTQKSESSETVVAIYTSSASGKTDTSDLFSDRDLKQTADTSDAAIITVTNGKTIDITSAGVYVISGTATDCTIKVNAGDEDKVQLVLDGVDITNTDSPAIYVVNADKTFITTTSGNTNKLTVTGSFTADGDTNTDAVIFSKDDLVLNGLGTITVSSAYGNGITSKDDLKVTGGSYSITSALDAIEANDSIRICDGSFTIKASKDGLHCENSDDNTLGNIYIAGGTFDITAVSDGIQGTTVTQIDGGTFTISAAEGIESTYVQINGGDITISANDDGINAANKSSAESVTFEMTGGKLSITMASGDTDAIDSNGNVKVSGGTIDITCPTQGTAESFDYDGTATYTGGTITVNGEQLSEIPTPMMMGGGGFGGQQGGFGGQQGGGRGGFRM